ncbi:MAG: RNA polymerase sigma factor [Bacteroidales bacterium]|nr:RNA polymerase sigma factor [Bacteroidales bacterium]
MLALEDIISGCKRNERKAQKLLYDKFSPIMMGLCLRYAKDNAEAEDVLQEGFIKIFSNIDQYNGEGSFEGWMKRIVINTAISNYRKNLKRYYQVDIEEPNVQSISSDWKTTEYTKEELLNTIKTLPEGYKIVFNLYAIEGYKHKEIGELLGIDETTSKSQYSRAKKQIQEKLAELSKIKIVHEK